MKTQWSGTFVALATPFRGGEVDEPALRKLVRRCIDGGLDGLVPCGTTGEAATLTEGEMRRVVEVTLDETAGAVPVIAGTGANSTRTVIARTQLVQQLGCQGALIVTPYYNKPTQAGLIAHYRAIAEAVPGFPMMLYNVPSRTSVNMLPSTVAALAELDEVVAIKEAGGDIGQVQRLLAAVGGRVAVFSGDDAFALPMYGLGAQGLVSVAANVVPAAVAELWKLARAGRWTEAASLQQRLFPLFEALFVETNPGPCKAALALLGVCEDEQRLPLVPVEEASRNLMRRVLERLEAIVAQA